jgi:hypothetical protein
MSISFFIIGACPMCGSQILKRIARANSGCRVVLNARLIDFPSKWKEEMHLKYDEIEDEYGKKLTVDEFIGLVNRRNGLDTPKEVEKINGYFFKGEDDSK